jgi:hypothetical protein
MRATRPPILALVAVLLFDKKYVLWSTWVWNVVLMARNLGSFGCVTQTTNTNSNTSANTWTTYWLIPGCHGGSPFTINMCSI